MNNLEGELDIIEELNLRLNLKANTVNFTINPNNEMPQQTLSNIIRESGLDLNDIIVDENINNERLDTNMEADNVSVGSFVGENDNESVRS